jgi:hypothetical protein
MTWRHTLVSAGFVLLGLVIRLALGEWDEARHDRQDGDP